MRAELTANDCASGDLELEPAIDTQPLVAKLQAKKYTDPKQDPCGPAGTGVVADDSGGSCACHTTPQRRVPAIPLLIGAFGVFSMLRGWLRRRRR
jgi:MYXO-CTERM domain-containing protein